MSPWLPDICIDYACDTWNGGGRGVLMEVSPTWTARVGSSGNAGSSRTQEGGENRSMDRAPDGAVGRKEFHRDRQKPYGVQLDEGVTWAVMS
jgi:hypothetical protein